MGASGRVGGLTPKSRQFLVRPSLYQRVFDEFSQYFQANQVTHVTFEEVIVDPKQILTKIAFLLSIDDCGFDLNICAQNKSANPRFEKFNSTLENSSAKTLLRRHLPHWVKPVAKSIWFSNDVAPISDAEMTNLSEAIWQAH